MRYAWVGDLFLANVRRIADHNIKAQIISAMQHFYKGDIPDEGYLFCSTQSIQRIYYLLFFALFLLNLFLALSFITGGIIQQRRLDRPLMKRAQFFLYILQAFLNNFSKQAHLILHRGLPSFVIARGVVVIKFSLLIFQRSDAAFEIS